MYLMQYITKPKLIKQVIIIKNKRTLVYNKTRTCINQRQFDMLKYFDGKHNLAEIGYELSQEYQAYADYTEIEEFVHYAKEKGWISI